MNPTPQVTIIIVTRNSKMFMTSCLDSIMNQTYRDFQTIVIDNDSSDGTLELVRREFPMVGVIDNNKNLGFARANNHGIRMFKSPFVVLCNPDIVLDHDWLEKMMANAEARDHSQYSVFGGKLLKLRLINAEIGEMEKTSVIDSCGLKVLKSGRVVELGSGETADKFTAVQEVFGFSAALVMFRREALEDIILKDRYHPQGDYLDGSFFFYKEDVDLAWRLALAGNKSLLLPQATAYHLRTSAGSEQSGNIAIAKNRRRQGSLARYYSYRNHLLLMLEDEFISNLLLFSPQIVWLEFKKFAYLLFLEPSTLLAWFDLARLLPQIMSKRRHIFSLAKADAKAMRRWRS